MSLFAMERSAIGTVVARFRVPVWIQRRDALYSMGLVPDPGELAFQDSGPRHRAATVETLELVA